MRAKDLLTHDDVLISQQQNTIIATDCRHFYHVYMTHIVLKQCHSIAYNTYNYKTAIEWLSLLNQSH